MGKVRRMYADPKYHNFKLYDWVGANVSWVLSIIRRPMGTRGWVTLPIRWTVERTFAWLGRCRRLSKDREKSVLSEERPVVGVVHQAGDDRVDAPSP